MPATRAHVGPHQREVLHLVHVLGAPLGEPQCMQQCISWDLALGQGIGQHVPRVDPSQSIDAAVQQVLPERFDIVQHLLLSRALVILVVDGREHRHSIDKQMHWDSQHTMFQHAR